MSRWGVTVRSLLGRNCYVCYGDMQISRVKLPPCFHIKRRLEAFALNLAYCLMVLNTPPEDYLLWSQFDWPWNTYKDRLWARQQYSLYGYVKHERPQL